MGRNRTFGQKIGAGFALIVMLVGVISGVAIVTLREVVAGKDRVITVNAQLLIDGQALYVAIARKSAAARGFLLTREERFLDHLRDARGEFGETSGRLRRGVQTEEGRRLLDAIVRAEAGHQEAVDRVIALRQGSAAVDAVAQAFEDQVEAKGTDLRALVASFVDREEQLLAQARDGSTAEASGAIRLLTGLGLAVGVFAVGSAVVLTRTLARQIGSAVGQVQSSSAELQAAANQQATGAKQQATAMNEITTTISELLATSRQIAESAQRVAQIAEQTAGAARNGEGTVDRAHESITGIQHQVEQIVGHMLELGKKSQQIGAVLEMVSELAEQTNILAINANIEAAGAGEAGRRFAVVADEIRKLADRVADAAKEIRGLIEDVRSAVNTTVMATESGSKAVDSGSRQFGDVTSAFRHIAGLLSTTTEAAREIELSTKQQASAVEQVNVAVSNVAQATKETEASSSQTLQTASQLSGLSRDLLRLVQPGTGARA